MPLLRLAAATLALLAPIATAQTAQTAPPAPPPLPGSIATHPDWPKAAPADVSSIDAIVASLYNVISGPAGQPRDWIRFQSLFLPDARLIPARPAKDSPHADAVVLSPDAYIARSSPTMAASGFFERGVSNQVQQFGNIAHVWSTYESRHTAADPAPFARGINSITLLKDADRYWIVLVLWDSERPNNPIPSQYLPQAAATSPATPSASVFAPIRVYAGAWTMTSDHPISTSGQPDQLVNRCTETTAFYNCEQVVNGKPAALVVFTSADQPNHFYVQAVLPSGKATGRTDLLLNGDHWTYRNTATDDAGKTIYYRTENLFTGPDRIHYDQYESADNQTWTRKSQGDENRTRTP